MNLNAIQPRKRAIEANTATELAQRNRAATNGNLLFRDTRPVIEAVAKGLREAVPVKPVALPASATASSDLTAVLKAMTDGITACAAAIRGPAQAQKAAAAPAVRSTGNPSSVPMRTETQRCREAEARELARKNAAQADAERVQVKKAGGRVRVLKVLDPSLSDAALMALSHIVTRCEATGQQSMPIDGADLSCALDIPLRAAQAGYAELVNKGHIRSAKSPLGVTHVTPSRAAAGL